MTLGYCLHCAAPPSRLVKDEYEQSVHVEGNSPPGPGDHFRGVPGM